MEPELPWSWRNNRRRQCSVPWGDTYKYRSHIAVLTKLIRCAKANKTCADCGKIHSPQGPLLREKPQPNTVAFANPMLGIIVCEECFKYHKEVLRPEGLGKLLYLFYDLHEWSLDDIAQMARWGNIRAQRFWLQKFSPEVKTYQGIVPRPASISPREWIERKYIQREWMMDDTSIPVRRLLPYDVYEQRVFAHLHRMNWTPPASAFSTISTPSGTPLQGSPLSVSTESATRGTAALNKKPEESPPIINKLLTIEVPVSSTLFASQSFPKVANEPAVPPAIHCLQTFPPLPPPLWKSSTAKPLDWSTRHPTPKPVSSPPHPPATSPPALPSPSSSRAESWNRNVPRIQPHLSPIDKDLTWWDMRYHEQVLQLNNHDNHDHDSEYSDDLYGSGRPLRPSLINPEDKIQEWQASSYGNPEVTQFLEDTFQPSSPHLDEITPSTPTTQAIESAMASFFQDKFQAAVTSKPAPTLAILDNKAAEKIPSKELEILIPVGEDVPDVVDKEVAQVGVGVEEGNTIIEEDASILADLDTAFATMNEHVELLRMYEVGGGQVDYRYMSDKGTEVDSEFDKIEYEFRPVRGDVSEEEMDFEMENSDENVEDQRKVVEMRYSTMETGSTCGDSRNPGASEDGARNGDAADGGVVPQSSAVKGYELDIIPPQQDVDESNFALEGTSSLAAEQSRGVASDKGGEERSPYPGKVREPVSSSPFSDIFLGVHLDGSDDVSCQKKDGKDLRDFLLKSGLFARKK